MRRKRRDWDRLISVQRTVCMRRRLSSDSSMRTYLQSGIFLRIYTPQTKVTYSGPYLLTFLSYHVLSPVRYASHPRGLRT